MPLADRIRAGLHAIADPARAVGQQAYMKSAMPFHGVPVPEARRIARAVAKSETDRDVLLEAALELWNDAAHREERYAAMTLLGLRPLRADPRLMPVVEHMVRTGRWWDITDELAHRLADAHDARPAVTAALVRRWSIDEDVWVRRIAILSQLGRRDRVDRDLLADVIEPNIPEREFFIRKAIGWALREYARVDPEWVRRFVAEHELSPLSVREALKHL
ncbi:DNA alkylation repair protein [Microbacterium immunditiarum]|uniref:3-methyladenine DNA glycosylase AlkD n=1 Tax=Microbacterium immunditiarum TaxID=337480 RepID=A0A7Y9KK79_9MICO|nr:DNA alkylation repair protein [Microbacterium immunditiarum]NYE20436.1 3-methyladenine DNA glycosylase AlkD [Microbacterium immunditiarum]